MRIFEFAMYNYAVRLMTPAERMDARRLARLADEGDPDARTLLREMVLYLIRTRPDGRK